LPPLPKFGTMTSLLLRPKYEGCWDCSSRASIQGVLSSDLLMELLELRQHDMAPEVANMNAFSPTMLLEPLQGFESSHNNMAMDAQALHA
jgi:hypothetical protein